MVHEHVDRVFERDGLSLYRTLVQAIGSRFGEIGERVNVEGKVSS